MTDSESVVVKPFRNVFRFFGLFIDAIYHFFGSLINPQCDSRSKRRLRDSGISSSAKIGSLRPHGSGGGNAPNMSIGGCKSCM